MKHDLVKVLESKGVAVELAGRLVQYIGAIKRGHSVSHALTVSGLEAGQVEELEETYPVVATYIGAAERSKARLIAHDIVEIADTDNDYTRARNRIDARKWLSSRLDPIKFGDKQTLEINQTIDLGAALAEAAARSLPERYQTKTIDAECSVISDTSAEIASGSKPLALDDTPAEKNAGENQSDDIFS